MNGQYLTTVAQVRGYKMKTDDSKVHTVHQNVVTIDRK